MINNDFKKLINKYAILIFIGYSLDFLITTVIHRLVPDLNPDISKILSILASSTWLIQLIINIIAAILISNDLKKFKIKNNVIVIMTILFSLIGITIFFISINREKQNASA